MTGPPTVAVLRKGAEGLSIADYAAELSRRLPGESVAYAPTPRAEAAAVASACVVTGVTVDPDLLARAKRLALFVCTFSGTDHLPLVAFADRDVTVTVVGMGNVGSAAVQQL